MIKAILFDLDGTLVQTEKLKGLSYAIAVRRVLGLPEPETRAIDAYREVVGSDRDVASRHVIESVGKELLEELERRRDEHGVDQPDRVLTAMRKEVYDSLVADPQTLRDNQWPHTVNVLRVAREIGCRTGLATMSQRPEALHVLRALDLIETLDLVLTREDVRKPKPDPEIYLKATKTLHVDPAECLVLEDSPAGVKAAVAAGTNVVALATPFTTLGLHRAEMEAVLSYKWVVYDPADLPMMIERRIHDHDSRHHPPPTSASAPIDGSTTRRLDVEPNPPLHTPPWDSALLSRHWLRCRKVPQGTRRCGAANDKGVTEDAPGTGDSSDL